MRQSSKMRQGQLLVILLAVATWGPACGAQLSNDVRAALAWYDTLGFPNARDLPYVRVATGQWTQSGNGPRIGRFMEGFLVKDEPDAFTVFLCSISDFKRESEGPQPYESLSTVRFVRKTGGAPPERIDYEALDFNPVSLEALDRVRTESKTEMYKLASEQPVAHRARIFAFARACLQKDLSETGSALMEITSQITEKDTPEVKPWLLRETLQREIGDAVLVKAEADCVDPSVSWADLLKAYQDFGTRFPGSPKVAYAEEAATVLRKMTAEEAAHHPVPYEQMSRPDQVAENIYQLRNLGHANWIMHSRYPVYAYGRDGKEVLTPVHRLADFGTAAVPQLIAALDDARFTRCATETFHGWDRPVAMRVRDVAQRILEHISGRNFYPRRADDGKLINGTTRQQAEAWWAEVQKKGEKGYLVEVTRSGGEAGAAAARRLAEAFPDEAIPAVEVGVRAGTSGTQPGGTEAGRGEYVDAAAKISGDRPLAFLQSMLAPENGLSAQMRAAEALLMRRRPDGVVPVLIEAWRSIQSRFEKNQSDAYWQAGPLITLLARSASPEAIDALAQNGRQAPVDVRLAVVEVFFPPPMSASMGAGGPTVSVGGGQSNLPEPVNSAPIERLLVEALGDSAQRLGMSGYYDEVSFKDPRVCDIAALVLSRRWPDKYSFHWSASSAECDEQIMKLRAQWRTDHGLSAL
jgi:hypothetical protein